MPPMKVLVLAAIVLPNMLWAATSAAIAELSRRSQVPQEELRVILEDCERTPRNMELCAFYGAVAAELALDAVIEETGVLTPENYLWFKDETRAACAATVRRQQSGVPTAVAVQHCIESAFRYRHDVLTGLGEILPPPHPPHKWD